VARLQDFDHRGTHRLIPTKFTTVSVLETLPLPAETLSDLSELDAATNERKVGERGGNSGISPLELVYQVPEAHIVNSAFTHPGPHGGRFNDARRGAWYAGLELDTSIREVAFHKRRFLRDAHFKGRQTFDYADFLADFAGGFNVLDEAEQTDCLKPSPVPQCYAASQALANILLVSGSSGIVYPSVRHAGGTCIACFRPALVHNPRRGKIYGISLAAEGDEVESGEVAKLANRPVKSKRPVRMR
jgi:RES domain-containing protein